MRQIGGMQSSFTEEFSHTTVFTLRSVQPWLGTTSVSAMTHKLLGLRQQDLRWGMEIGFLE